MGEGGVGEEVVLVVGGSAWGAPASHVAVVMVTSHGPGGSSCLFL